MQNCAPSLQERPSRRGQPNSFIRSYLRPLWLPAVDRLLACFGGSVKNQLEALVAQMHESGILYSEAVREFKKRFIMNVLDRNHGNQSKAARELGMHRNTLSRTISELDLDLGELRNAARRPPRSVPAELEPLEKKAVR